MDETADAAESDRMTKSPPRSVTPFEGKLLTILRAIVQQEPVELAVPLLAEPQAAPSGLSRAAVELIQESLIHGCVLHLARSGGWRRERFLRDGKAVEGRLWQRTDPGAMPLDFSRRSLDWLVWLASARWDDPPGAIDKPGLTWTVADRLLILLTLDSLRDADCFATLCFRPVAANDGLIRLAFPEHFVASTVDPDFAPWFSEAGAAVLESLQTWLAQRWIEVEQAKSQMGDWQSLAECGREQERILTAFADAAEKAGRLDLMRFTLQASAPLLRPDATIEMLYPGLHTAAPARLADRVEVARRALALPRHVLRLREAERRAGTIGYLDDGYAAAQQWLSDWERLGGDRLAAKADELIHAAEPIQVGN